MITRSLATAALFTLLALPGSGSSLAAKFAAEAHRATVLSAELVERRSDRVEIFVDRAVCFAPDAPADPALPVEDSGRVVVGRATLPELAGPGRLVARVALRAVPKDPLSVHDPWDRAGNVRLVVPGRADVELVKFVTAYGGDTVHEADVTHLAPLLVGDCEFRAFVDTWNDPGWRLDFEIVHDGGRGGGDSPVWADGLIYAESVTAASQADGPLKAVVDLPAGLSAVSLFYLVSGHCTDGRGADEFETKTHVVRVDGTEVLRHRPWRDDCRRLRDRNPYTKRWSAGYWSSDFSRSGWCPGDAVQPVRVELGALAPGRHVVEVEIGGIREKDGDGNFGYWRVSAHLAGWR